MFCQKNSNPSRFPKAICPFVFESGRKRFVDVFSLNLRSFPARISDCPVISRSVTGFFLLQQKICVVSMTNFLQFNFPLWNVELEDTKYYKTHGVGINVTHFINIWILLGVFWGVWCSEWKEQRLLECVQHIEVLSIKRSSCLLDYKGDREAQLYWVAWIYPLSLFY